MKFIDVIKFIRVSIKQRNRFAIWSIVLAISSFGPVVSVYLVTEIINYLADDPSVTDTLLLLIGTLLFVVMADNISRLLAKTRLARIIYAIEFETQIFLINAVSSSRVGRERMIKAVVNLTDALRSLLVHVKESGISAITRIILIPTVLFTRNKTVFMLEITYILLYFSLDYFTTRRYKRKVDAVNDQLEKYFEKILKKSDKIPFVRLLRAITDKENFTFWEWTSLQNLSNVYM